jgi:hypothetical protein
VVVEQEVAVEDVVWAAVVAAAAVVVEEDVVAEASDQPTTKTRTKNNHCLEATSTRIRNCPGASRRLNRHLITSIVSRIHASWILPKAVHTNGQKTRFVVAEDLATIAKRKILPTENPSTSAYSRLLLPFYFYELQKKENAISFTIKTLWAFPFLMSKHVLTPGLSRFSLFLSLFLLPYVCHRNTAFI